MKFQYNKMAIQRIEKDLQIRMNALPTLKAKETALRMEAKKMSRQRDDLDFEYRAITNQNREFAGLWMEFPDLLTISKSELEYKNIAGAKIPVLKNIEFKIREYSLYANRAWTPGAAELLKEMTILSVQISLINQGLAILQQVRKKTTQKVNLYEKVQIPEYRDAIRKIKRFIEDEENLSRASQKMVKERHLAEAGFNE